MKKNKLIGFKGFNKNMTCRNFQYEEGKTYKMEEEPEICNKGFHFCEYPLDCFNYYEPTESVFHKVESTGKTDKENNSGTKISTNEIKIGARLSWKDIVDASIEFVMKHAEKGEKGANKRTDKSVSSNTGYKSVSSNTGYKSVSSNTGDNSVSSNTGNYSVSSNTGYKSVSSNTGNYSVSSNTGYKSVSSNTGDNSVSSNTGNYSVSSNTGDNSVSSNTGNYSVSSNTGYKSVSSNTGNYSVSSNTGYKSVSSNTGDNSVSSNTGNYSVSSNTGDNSVSSNTGNKSVSSNTGYKSASKNTGKSGISSNLGIYGQAAGKIGIWLVLAEWVEKDWEYELKEVKAVKVDGKKIKEDTYYSLEDGKFVEKGKVEE